MNLIIGNTYADSTHDHSGSDVIIEALYKDRIVVSFLHCPEESHLVFCLDIFKRRFRSSRKEVEKERKQRNIVSKQEQIKRLKEELKQLTKENV